MCGVAGFWAQPGSAEALAEQARRMAQPLRPRGPDAEGVWVDAAAGLAFSHRRLAVIDLSEAGAQPMLSSCGRFAIAYNGELYNAAELRDALCAEGRRFRGRSDTEVLAEACAAWGLRPALRRALGMFAFAAWDRQRRTLYLVRDRLGIKPLYYGAFGGVILFGSELKALRAHPAFEPRVSRLGAAAFLRNSYLPNPLTIYEGVHALPPGAVLTRRADGAESLDLWRSLADAVRAGRADPFSGSAAEAADALEELLRDAVQRRMAADVPLGVFLSGGFDSSTVVALMQSLSPRPVKSFSIGFRERRYDEAPHAAAVARHLGTEHTELYVTPREALAVIPQLPEIYDEPFADASQVPTHILSLLARREVTVALSGDGGDELFAGYDHYAGNLRSRRSLGFAAKQRLRRGSVALLESAFSAPRPPAIAKLIQRRRRRLASGARRLSFERLTNWPHAELMPEVPEAEVRAAFHAALPEAAGADDLSRMLYADAMHYLPDDILTKVDRASMAASLEVRVPLLDHRVVEFAWRLPGHFKLRRNESKWLLRQVLYRHVPRALVERPKQGFLVAYGGWLRGPLRDWAEDLLSESALAGHGLFRSAPIRARWREHCAGRDRDHLLWPVLMFQAWWRRWMR